ncbi:MAG: archaeosine biosynthesis radical SAM protein RaSEA [Candidatus Thorarchaeota archaeon]
MKNLNDENLLVEKVKYLRKKSMDKKRKKSLPPLDRPVSFWIKEDRLLNGKGKELAIVLRTKGCSWALSEKGGCSMCGYINDSYLQDIDHENILKQFEFALQSKLEQINSDQEDYVLKIFNSGSFFDDNEISEQIREKIYKKVANIDKIKEIVVESRPEYISKVKLEAMQNLIKNKYIEIAIGLETVNDKIRNQYINKGLLYKDFLKTVQICKELKFGIRVYLLFKPPFLNEYAAIDDCLNSIEKLIHLKVDTISINPTNIQKDTLVELLWLQNRYRPPWFYSLFKCLIKANNDIKGIKNARIISDPSGAGSKRGIHNCLKRDCNENMIIGLKNYVLSQDITHIRKIKDSAKCDCKILYHLQKKYH